jgi:ethanolamine ammonia-lyase small subunit
METPVRKGAFKDADRMISYMNVSSIDSAPTAERACKHNTTQPGHGTRPAPAQLAKITKQFVKQYL